MYIDLEDLLNMMFLGNFRRDSCEYSPSSSPDVINVGGTQEAVDTQQSRYSGMNYKLLLSCILLIVVIYFEYRTHAVLVQFTF